MYLTRYRRLVNIICKLSLEILETYIIFLLNQHLFLKILNNMNKEEIYDIHV